MKLLKTGAVLLAVSASLASEDDITLEMRAALEAQAQLPASMPELPRDSSPPGRDPGRGRPPGKAREEGLAAADHAVESALRRVSEHAAAAALEVLTRDVEQAFGAPTTAQAATWGADGAVDLSQSAEARGAGSALPRMPPPESPLPAPDPPPYSGP